MKAIKYAVAAAALTLSGAAMAGPGWTFVELGYDFGDNDVGNMGPFNAFSSKYEDGTKGYRLDGSLGFGSMYHAALKYGKSDYYKSQNYQTNSERRDYQVTLGIHPAVTDSTDLVVEINYLKSEYKSDALNGACCKYKDSGAGLAVGLRSMLSDTVEGNAKIGMQKTDLKDVEVALEAGGAWNFATNWALTADAKIGESESTIGAGIRWYLGQYNKL